jgi:hypothetical protein
VRVYTYQMLHTEVNRFAAPPRRARNRML